MSLTQPTAPRWDLAITEYRHALNARGYYASSTVENLVKRIRRYANECGHDSPWQATPARIQRWLDGLDVTTRVLYDYRIGLRTFYRWAVEAGRMATDPTSSMWGRRQELQAGPLWMAAIPPFLTYLRGAGCTRATIRLRRQQIINLGRSVGVADPWLVTPDDLVEWMGTRGAGRSTLKSTRSAVQSFYRWAHLVGHVDTDPARTLPTVRLPPPQPRPATDSEIARALASADPRVTMMIRLAAELGLRVGELCKVQTGDLARDASGWWLYVKGKGDRTRRLPVTDDLAGAILAHRPDGGHLFPGQIDGHVSVGYAGKLISRHLPPGVTPHKLRHRFATSAYAVTRDVLAVQQLLGHSSPTTTQAYVAVPAENLRHLVNAVHQTAGRRA